MTTMTPPVKHFFEFNIHLLDKNDFDTFFLRAEGEFLPSTVNDIGIYLESAGIMPIEHMTFIPEGYYMMAMTSHYVTPKNINSIHYKAFSVSDVQKVTITSNVKEIQEQAFEGCDFLEEVLIEEGLTTILDHAFDDCDDLRKVTLPRSLVQIGRHTFRECSNLTYLKYNGTAEEWQKVMGSDSIHSTSYISKIICSDKTINL